MSLDGLRAWIGEVERKLGARTRVFLVLAAIAIGGAGAAIYLALDTREGAVSDNDVQALQERLEAQSGDSAESAELAQLEGEVSALKAQVEALSAEEGTAAPSAPERGGRSGAADEEGAGAAGEATGGATVPEQPSAAKLKDLLEKAAEDAK